MMLSIFSCAYWSFIDFPWINSDPWLIFSLVTFLLVVRTVYVFWIQVLSQIHDWQKSLFFKMCFLIVSFIKEEFEEDQVPSFKRMDKKM